MKRLITFAAGLLTVLSIQATAVSVGEAAPDFTLATLDSSSYTLSSLQGQVRVVYFFGCG